MRRFKGNRIKSHSIAELSFMACMVFFLSGCATFSKLPTPSPGLVLFINPNEWAKGEILAFDPAIGQNNLFQLSSGGIMMLKSPPLARIKITSASAANIPSVSYGQFQPNQSYSLVHVWESWNGRFISLSYDTLTTTGKILNESYTDFLNRRYWADRVIYLPKINSTPQLYRLQILPPK